MTKGGMHGEGGCVWYEACMAGGVHSRGMHGRGNAWQGSMHGRGVCMAGEMATAADGMHPTGMHSRFDILTTTWWRLCHLLHHCSTYT